MSDSPTGCSTNAIFEEPWWLDAVAPGRWGEVLVRSGGAVVGRLPYVAAQGRLGWRYLEMPPLTQTLGPWVSPGDGKPSRQLARGIQILDELIAGLPECDSFDQCLHWSLSNWLPFHWRGYTQTTCYTYALEDLTDTDAIWHGFAHNVRKECRKAQRQLTIRDDLGLERFLELNGLTFARRGVPAPYSSETVRRLDLACAARRARRILFALDGQGRVHAGVYLVWDSRSAYYLMAGADPARRTSGAQTLLLWEAIRFAAGVTRRFDFEGSMMPEVERFLRSFGGRLVPYFRVRRVSKRVQLLRAGRLLGRTLSGSWSGRTC